MKKILYSFILTLTITFTIGLLNSYAIDPIKELKQIEKINNLKKRAIEASNAQKWEESMKIYDEIIATYNDINKTPDQNTYLNMAHVYYQLNLMPEATKWYGQSNQVEKPNNELSSIAYQQLGNIAFEESKNQKEKKSNQDPLELAKGLYAKALLKNPKNQEARRNLEKVLRKIKENQENQDQNKDQNKDQDQDKDKKNKDKKDNKDGDNKDKKDGDKEEKENSQENKEEEGKDGDKDKKEEEKEGEGKEGENKEQEEQKKQEEKSESEKKKEEQQKRNQQIQQQLQNLNLTPEKAKQLLQAMKNQEVQYIQQLRKKGKATGRNQKDW